MLLLERTKTSPQLFAFALPAQSAICNLQSAICNLQSAICNLQSAICGILPTIVR